MKVAAPAGVREAWGRQGCHSVWNVLLDEVSRTYPGGLCVATQRWAVQGCPLVSRSIPDCAWMRPPRAGTKEKKLDCSGRFRAGIGQLVFVWRVVFTFSRDKCS